MPECPAIDEVYLAESTMSDCLRNEKLLRAVRHSSAEYVNVSGGLETGGGIAIDTSMLPHLQIEDNETLVLTASHIVSSGKPTLLGTYDKNGQLQDLYQGQVIFSDTAADLALIKVNIKNRHQRPRAINYYDLREAQTGEAAIAFQPEDEQRNVGIFTVASNNTYGAVGGAAIREQYPKIRVADSTQITLLNQIDRDGTSGSPLVAGDGKILGIVSQRITSQRLTTPTNLNHTEGSLNTEFAGTVAIGSEQIKNFLKKVDQEVAISQARRP